MIEFQVRQLIDGKNKGGDQHFGAVSAPAGIDVTQGTDFGPQGIEVQGNLFPGFPNSAESIIPVFRVPASARERHMARPGVAHTLGAPNHQQAN